MKNSELIAILGDAAYEVYANTPKFDDVNWSNVVRAVLSRLAELGPGDEAGHELAVHNNRGAGFRAALASLAGGEG